MTTMNSFLDIEIPPVRMAVLRDSQPQVIATVVMTEQTDGQIKLSISGDDTDTQKVAIAAEEVAAGIPKSGQPAGERLLQLQVAIRIRLQNEGFQIKDLPTSDITLSFEFDAKSGHMISNQEPLHDLAKVDSTIGRNIHAALAEVFVKGPMDLAAEIVGFVNANDHIGAAEAVKNGRKGLGFFGVLPPELLEALQRIQVSGLDKSTSKQVRECRMAVATMLNRYDLAEGDAFTLLNETDAADQAMRASIENVIAIASAKRGAVETALSIWRNLLKVPENLDPTERAWIWRNLSMTLPALDSEAVKAARLSVDAFLEAGNKREAATSLMHLSRLLEFESPSSAIGQLDGMLEIITQKGLIGTELRAAIHHARGNRLRELRQHPQALEAALRAVELRREVTGLEEQLISSLHLAAEEAENCGNVELTDTLSAEAKKLEAAVSSVHFKLARRIQHLFSKFDHSDANEIIAEANVSGHIDLITSAGVAVATTDPDLDATARLRRLEAILYDLERRRADEDVKQPVLIAIATTLRDDGQFSRAATWLRRILDSHPFALDARDMLIDSLWKAEDWGGAAIFLSEQIDLHGEAPGLLYAYGKSLIEAGNVSEAVSILSKALKFLRNDDVLHKTTLDLRERALELGGTFTATPVGIEGPRPVLRDELEQALREFAIFVAADKRMGFWTRPELKDDYVWMPKPEQRGQDLLHTFLKARFQSRISLFEELDTGAGRLDLLLKLDGGLSIIIELKMCGFGYSSAYAASGEEQIRHYMQNRSSHLGYLIVFDARLESYSSQLIQGEAEGADTIYEIFVDMRPRVSSRRKAK